MPRRPLALATLLATTLALAPVQASAQRTAPPAAAPASDQLAEGDAVTSVSDVDGQRVEVVAVGDIACRPGARVSATTCRHGATARLTKRIAPDAVLALGDLQYEVGSLRAFRKSYDKSWGDLRSITYPTPGNHEYDTSGAAGYYTYFSGRTPDRPGHYAFDLGTWRAYVLNSNCGKVSCGRAARWLRKELRRNPRDCSLVATHFPRYSTGGHGSNRFMKRFYRIAHRNGVDLMLAGHDHHYERFRRMNHRGGVADHGVMQFVSGGGGKNHHRAHGKAKGSMYVEDDTFGVLRLVLRPGSFRHGFRGIDGSRQDNGTRSCV